MQKDRERNARNEVNDPDKSDKVRVKQTSGKNLIEKDNQKTAKQSTSMKVSKDGSVQPQSKNSKTGKVTDGRKSTVCKDLDELMKLHVSQDEDIGGSRGGVPSARPPKGPDSFIFQNVTVSGVHVPPTRSTPPTGNPGSATGG